MEKDSIHAVTESMEDGTAKKIEITNGKSPKKFLTSEGIILAVIGLGFWGAASIVLLVNKLFN